jgi:hypothetical protein
MDCLYLLFLALSYHHVIFGPCDEGNLFFRNVSEPLTATRQRISEQMTLQNHVYVFLKYHQHYTVVM